MTDVERVIDIFLTGTNLSPEEMADMRRWLAASDKADEKSDALMRQLSSVVEFSDAPVDAPKLWPALAYRLGIDPDAGRRAVARDITGKGIRVSLLRRVAFRVAAVLISAAMIVGGYLFWDSTRDVDAFVATASIAAQSDSIRHITLADGTRVTLNRNSTFSYNDHREGELTGEAWFEVTKEPEHPFLIHSDGLTVTVFGTEFNFSTKTENGHSVLSLYDGSVQLDYAAGTERLGAGGKEFTLDHATGLAEVHDFDTLAKPAWLTADKLIDILPLGEIFDLVESEYGVTIMGRDAVDMTKRYNFIPVNAAPIEDVMQALQLAGGGFHYRMDGDTITLEQPY